LLPLVYEELRKLAAARMAQEAQGHTLQATALVHEAWLRDPVTTTPLRELLLAPVFYNARIVLPLLLRDGTAQLPEFAI
jgi:hypothetical protein